MSLITHLCLPKNQVFFHHYYIKLHNWKFTVNTKERVAIFADFHGTVKAKERTAIHQEKPEPCLQFSALQANGGVRTDSSPSLSETGIHVGSELCPPLGTQNQGVR